MTISPTTLALGFGVVVLCVAWTVRPNRRLPLPPGPRRLPVIGNLLDLPKEKDWETYQRLSQTYGDIICLKALNTHIIVLNSAKVITDLLESRSAIYSDRPVKPVIGLFGHDWTFALWRYGPLWRRHRKLMHEEMTPASIVKYQGIQIRGARALLQRLLETGEDITAVIRKVIGASVVDIAYGLEERRDVENFIGIAEGVARMFSENTVPGAYMVDLIPALKYIPIWFPGAKTNRDAAACRTEVLRQLTEPMASVKRNIAEGRPLRSVALNVIEKIGTGGADSIPDLPDRSGLLEIPANTYVAGIDTTVSAATFFFIAMLLNPAVQDAAQREIDSVVGIERLPDYTDYPKLPYVQAIILEILRWYTPLPLALAHGTLEDDVYEGYHIPKGSIVVGNSWAALRDPSDYPEPDVFRPERFLKIVNGRVEVNKDVRNPRTLAFGFGRRICPGKFLAEQTLFAVFSSVLAAYTILPILGEDGRPVIPDLSNMAPGLILQPAPFKCSFKPRSTRAADLIAAPLPERDL